MIFNNFDSQRRQFQVIQNDRWYSWSVFYVPSTVLRSLQVSTHWMFPKDTKTLNNTPKATPVDSDKGCAWELASVDTQLFLITMPLCFKWWRRGWVCSCLNMTGAVVCSSLTCCPCPFIQGVSKSKSVVSKPVDHQSTLKKCLEMINSEAG